MTLKQLKLEFSTISYWWHSLRKAIVWKSNAFIEADERAVRNEIANKLYEIKTIIDKYYSEKIGKAVTKEINSEIVRKVSK